MGKKMIITIDGPAGVGKTTLAKALAQSLKIAYLDTGAMFRAAAWILGPDVLSLRESELALRLKDLHFRIQGTGAGCCLMLEGQPISDQVRTEETGMLASRLAGLQVVREFMKKSQQQMGKEISLVAEGRDMGSVVFLDADYKFYFQADPKIRAARRYAQLRELGLKPDKEKILMQIRQRDAQDENRAIAPLKPAADAVHIDTGGHDPKEILERMLQIIGNCRKN